MPFEKKQGVSGSDLLTLALYLGAAWLGLSLLLNRGVQKISYNYGNAAGIAVATGQYCAKYPNTRNCPHYIQRYSGPALGGIEAQVQTLFNAGRKYPNEANPYAAPGYEFSVSYM